ncbi:uncharacterized protein LOC132743496 isoform X2 [Ruditapes philippinarum]|uniref:uncharacterized protein LOC132743496 isoform X2 n=1 Tax=Ruditapes philippinarum TaxID=129788 RepID=UPI00295BDCD6|nr:uncharacterized protein LOC132743496 isoform X2 [Ruditapes philippinarum]
MSEDEKTGCFTWCVRLRDVCNKRWARMMNRLRRRLHGRRGQRVDPETIIDETGARDMVLTKSYIVIPDILASKDTGTDTPRDRAINDQDFDRQVEEYVAGILKSEVDTLTSDSQLLSNTKLIKVDADDNISLTSSVISQIADIAVTQSLSAIAMEADINQSANKHNKPKTFSDFIDVSGINADDKNVYDLPNGKT